MLANTKLFFLRETARTVAGCKSENVGLSRRNTAIYEWFAPLVLRRECCLSRRNTAMCGKFAAIVNVFQSNTAVQRIEI